MLISNTGKFALFEIFLILILWDYLWCEKITFNDGAGERL
jgi:hypothetical protein